MVGPRGPEGLGGRLVDLRSVAEDHGPHEAALRPRQHRAGEDASRPLAQGGRPPPCPAAPVPVAALEKARGLAVGEGRQALAHALGPPSGPQRRPDRHPVPVEKARLRRLAANFNPDATGAPLDPAVDLGLLGVDEEGEPAGPLDGVPAQRTHDPHRTALRGAVLDELPQAARLELEPLDDRGRRAQRERRGAQRGAGVPPPGGHEGEPKQQGGQPHEHQGLGALRLPVHQQATEAEERGESEDRATHGGRR